MNSFLTFLSLILGACFFADTTVRAAQTGQPCAKEHTQWNEAYGMLEEAVNELRDAKVASVEPKINQALADSKGLSVAQRIQTILKERSRRISEATRKGVEAADQERTAFEQLRRCGVSDHSRRSAPSTLPLNEMLRARNRILAELQELLADEAYAQYKQESPVPPSTYSGYGPDQQSAQYHNPQYNPGGRTGYGTYAPRYGYQ